MQRARFASPTGAWIALATLVLLLSACVPTSSEQAEVVTTPTGPVAYVPAETGSTWAYLPDRASLDEPPVIIRIEGPTVLDGVVRTAWRMVGRGLDVTWYREDRDEGRFLVREERPGARISFDPPIQELPAGPFRVGQTWGGETVATLVFPDAAADNRRSTLPLEYRSTIVDRRDVTVPAGTFEVFVLNLTTRTYDDEGAVVEELTQETWFSPFLGEVRTENGFFLIDSNLGGLERQAAP